MKKLLLTIMITTLLVIPFQGVALADEETSLVETPVVHFVPGGVPAETGVLDSVSPAIHGAVLSMLSRNAAEFDAADPAMGWETLYNMLALYGQMDDRAEYADEELILSAEIVTDFAAALFSDADALGPLPEELSDRMTYDAELDSYRLVCGSDDLAQIRLESSAEDGDTLEIAGSLVYLVDGTDLAGFRAELSPRDNLFGYAITALELV